MLQRAIAVSEPVGAGRCEVSTHVFMFSGRSVVERLTASPPKLRKNTDHIGSVCH